MGLSLPCVWRQGRICFASEEPGGVMHGLVGGGGGALTFLLEGIFVQFGTGLCGWVVGIPVGADCTPVVAGLILFCCVLVERGEGLCCVSF